MCRTKCGNCNEDMDTSLISNTENQEYVKNHTFYCEACTCEDCGELLEPGEEYTCTQCDEKREEDEM